MKVGMGLLNAPAASHSAVFCLALRLVGMFNPIYDVQLWLMWQRCGNHLLYQVRALNL